jgi:Putative zincin peptidase
LNTSTKTLPESYAQSGEINLGKNKRLAIALNIVAALITALTFYLLANLSAIIRPGIFPVSGNIMPGPVLFLVGLVIVILMVHELIHGFFFWVFTRSRPVFAQRLLYAYAGAPGWFIPARQFAFVSVSPLVIIDAAGLLLMLLGPENWVLITAFLIALNTGDAIGDLFVFTRLLKLPLAGLANDTGEVITFYEPTATVSRPSGRPLADVRPM